MHMIQWEGENVFVLPDSVSVSSLTGIQHVVELFSSMLRVLDVSTTAWVPLHVQLLEGQKEVKLSNNIAYDYIKDRY